MTLGSVAPLVGVSPVQWILPEKKVRRSRADQTFSRFFNFQTSAACLSKSSKVIEIQVSELDLAEVLHRCVSKRRLTCRNAVEMCTISCGNA